MDWIIPPVVVLTIAVGIYKVFELFVRRRERIMMIDKLKEISDINAKDLNLNLSGYSFGRFTSLRFGMVMLGIGLGFLLAITICLSWLEIDFFNNENWHYGRATSQIFFACICIGGGLFLVWSYFIERNAERRDREGEQRGESED